VNLSSRSCAPPTNMSSPASRSASTSSGRRAPARPRWCGSSWPSLGSADLVLLEGACSARESVPFRAFDGLIDALTAHLLRISGQECEALIHDIGESLYALSQIFPVLARVAVDRPAGADGMPEPQEMRRRAFHGLKSLLFRIAERRPLIVLLDNLQWGDLDSARLLDDLLAPPGVPPFLLISAYRRDEASPMLRDIALLRAMVTPPIRCGCSRRPRSPRGRRPSSPCACGAARPRRSAIRCWPGASPRRPPATRR
jgi:hypothetical protein